MQCWVFFVVRFAPPLQFWSALRTQNMLSPSELVLGGISVFCITHGFGGKQNPEQLNSTEGVHFEASLKL